MTITDLTHRELMTVEEVAEETRRTVASVRWLLHTKQLKSGKVGGRRLIRRSDLEAWIEAGFTEAG
ncbi:helix-turn-helix domain-containing protein [Microbacterium maritypicum]|uniref:Helix-turn-helix domain-containing protein n=1 Tax=Microbacterium maritypicum TaxID=33918 RepID=A0ACD4B4D1_MICMQ|nr:helix-turn-helix domain-containing protein [Microbacterium liquefaciens]UTT52312.1 helix-turn-helix domain-containing protein [Microbacterium liquefaciens]